MKIPKKMRIFEKSDTFLLLFVNFLAEFCQPFHPFLSTFTAFKDNQLVQQLLDFVDMDLDALP